MQKADAAAEVWELNRSAYHWPWLVRVYLIAEMRHAGVESLTVARDWNVEQLQQALRPDQNEWLPVWMTGVAQSSLKKLLRRLRFVEPLELLSCFACIMSDSTVMSHSLANLRQHTEQIEKARQQMRNQFG